MRHDWDHQHHPVHLPGSNSIETRVRLLEQRTVYEDREKGELRASIASLMAERERDREEFDALMRQVGFRVIAALSAAVGTLGLIVARLMFPTLF